MKIVLDCQHLGKPHRPFDRGAVYGDLQEAYLCLKYASIAQEFLTLSGHEVFLITSDYYGHRAKFSNKIAADLYLACHLNSSNIPPSKNYSLVEISELSGKTTKKFAAHLLDVFSNLLKTKNAGVHVIKRGERGWSCINRVRAPALLLEPLFINHPDTANHLGENIQKIAESIVLAINTFNWE